MPPRTSTAFLVEYTVSGPWHEGRIQRYFETLEAAEEFRAPLTMAARSGGKYHDMPTLQRVGVLIAEDGAMYALGPPLEFDVAVSIPVRRY